MSKRESKFQTELRNEIQEMYPDAIITKLDSQDIQGIPDLIILKDDKWATLECKKEKDSPHRPNQDYYVNKMDGMSFSSFIYPENKEAVLNELQQTFKSTREPLVP